MNVLWEAVVGANGQGTRWIGYTDNYMRVTANGPADLFNRITPVRLSDARADGLEGEVMEELRT